jgi:hypothetical protein
MMFLHHGKWRTCFETKRKGLFCDFWHIHDDFAIKNATNIIFKAGKAQSYSSLHDLSNGAKRCEILCRKRDKKLTLQRHCPLSSSSKKNNFALLNFLNFKYVLHTHVRLSHLSVYCWRSQHPLHAKKRPYLPRYRRTASLSTYTHIFYGTYVVGRLRSATTLNVT